jgi:hypothetical protein
MNPKLTAERLERGAIVYIRQSTPGQVLHHQEGRSGLLPRSLARNSREWHYLIEWCGWIRMGSTIQAC